MTRVSPSQRRALEAIRQAIRAAAPKAKECLSCGVGALRVDGKLLVALTKAQLVENKR